MCYKKSQYAEPSAKYPTKALYDVFKKNIRSNEDLKYQSFGSEDGILFVYPALKDDECGNYDPRLR